MVVLQKLVYFEAHLQNDKCEVFQIENYILFDTFESFDTNEFQYEQQLGRCPENFYQAFVDTNKDKVLSEMLYPEKCIIKKAYFQIQ